MKIIKYIKMIKKSNKYIFKKYIINKKKIQKILFKKNIKLNF